MKVTPDRLAVGHAVWDAAKEFFAAPDTAPIVDLDAVIEALPEPEPQYAPTGPGWWWAKRLGGWQAVNVGPTGRVWAGGKETPYDVSAFSAWVGPLTPPEVKP